MTKKGSSWSKCILWMLNTRLQPPLYLVPFSVHYVALQLMWELQGWTPMLFKTDCIASEDLRFHWRNLLYLMHEARHGTLLNQFVIIKYVSVLLTKVCVSVNSSA